MKRIEKKEIDSDVKEKQCLKEQKKKNKRSLSIAKEEYEIQIINVPIFSYISCEKFFYMKDVTLCHS